MATRLELHEAFLDILDSNNAYYQPPESVRMSYPCIVYEDEAPDLLRASDKIYRHYRHYSAIYITKKADDPTPDEILYAFKYISMGKPYKSDNLYHYPFELYY